MAEHTKVHVHRKREAEAHGVTTTTQKATRTKSRRVLLRRGGGGKLADAGTKPLKIVCTATDTRASYTAIMLALFSRDFGQYRGRPQPIILLSLSQKALEPQQTSLRRSRNLNFPFDKAVLQSYPGLPPRSRLDAHDETLMLTTLAVDVYFFPFPQNNSSQLPKNRVNSNSMRAEILHVTNGVIVVGLTLTILLILLSSLLLISVDWMSKARSERTGPYKTSSGSQEKSSTE